jgi:hypothetical protein
LTITVMGQTFRRRRKEMKTLAPATWALVLNKPDRRNP